MKGISPLIAAVLLIAITVAIATLVSGWISTVTRGSQIAAENKTTEAVDCAAAAVVIDDVYVTDNGATSTIRVLVRNAGQANDMEIGNVTVFNSSGGGLTASSPTLPTKNFDRGAVITYQFNSAPVPACPTDFQEAIVTTTCGGVFAKFDKTPKCS